MCILVILVLFGWKATISLKWKKMESKVVVIYGVKIKRNGKIYLKPSDA